MPIDASIPLGVRPPQFDSPLETYGKVEQLKGLRAQGQLRDLQMQEFQDKRTREQARRGILSKGLQGEELATELERGGFLDDATTYRKSIDERQDGRIKREGEIVKLYGELSRAVLANPTEQSAIAAIERIEQATGRKMDAERGQIYSLRGDPEGIRRMAAGAALEADKLLGKFQEMDVGGARVGGLVDPLTGQFNETFRQEKTLTPEAILTDERTRAEGAAGRAVTIRGQNMTDSRAREKNKIDSDAAGKVEWKQGVDGEWVALPKEVRGAGPVTPITTTVPGKRESQAKNALGIIKEAKTLIDKGTSSYIGAGVDQVARAFGKSTEGADAAAQLKALEGALMMAQPRMEGPQSDKDVALYRQMAAQLGDPTIPASQKRLALEVVERLHKRYAPEEAPKTVQTDSLPDPAQYPGAVMRDDQTGMRYQSDGKSWRRL